MCDSHNGNNKAYHGPFSYLVTPGMRYIWRRRWPTALILLPHTKCTKGGLNKIPRKIECAQSKHVPDTSLTFMWRFVVRCFIESGNLGVNISVEGICDVVMRIVCTTAFYPPLCVFVHGPGCTWARYESVSPSTGVVGFWEHWSGES
jgi:hypothetical protein